MQVSATATDRVRSFLVLAATLGTIAFNWLAATGRLAGVSTGDISEKYPAVITPAGYAFSIWTLIYLGLLAFSFYQLLPANLMRFRRIRSLYIMSCALNCGWLYFWHGEQMVICFAILVVLSIILLLITYHFRYPDSAADLWLVKAPFGLYFGWVTAAAIVNLAVMLVYLRTGIADSDILGAALILLAAGLAVVASFKLADYLFPLAVAWALTAIALKQSGRTVIVVACAAGVIACLVAALSFVLRLPTSTRR